MNKRWHSQAGEQRQSKRDVSRQINEVNEGQHSQADEQRQMERGQQTKNRMNESWYSHAVEQRQRREKSASSEQVEHGAALTSW